MEKWLGKNGEGYVIGQFIILGLILFAPANRPIFSEAIILKNPLTQLIGVAYIIMGIIMVIASILRLGRNLRAVPRPSENGKLIQEGFYDWVRHPIYSGILLASLGVALYRGGMMTLIYTILLFLWFDRKAAREELWLSEKYPDYPDYVRRVKKLIPFLY